MTHGQLGAKYAFLAKVMDMVFQILSGGFTRRAQFSMVQVRNNMKNASNVCLQDASLFKAFKAQKRCDEVVENKLSSKQSLLQVPKNSIDS